MRISDWSSDVCSSDLEGGGAPAKKEASAAAPAAPAAASAPAPAPAKTAEPVQDESASAALTLSPAVRRLVLEHGVDPTRIKGTGKEDRNSVVEGKGEAVRVDRSGRRKITKKKK